ncbi:MAG: AraC family transcriptional regulator ligand-binding domain-containing protein [Sphingomonas paucimobilis]
MLGVSVDLLACRSGIARNRLVDEIARFSVAELQSIWSATAALVHGGAAGVRLAQASSDAGRGPVAMAVLAAPTLGEGLCRAMRLEPLYSAAWFVIEHHGDRCVVNRRVARPEDEEPAVATQFALARLFGLMQIGTGSALVRTEVHFAAPRPNDWQDDALDCTVRFDAGRNAVVFDRRDLDLSFVSANSDLSDLLLPGLLARLEQFGPAGSISGRTIAIIRERLVDGRPEVASVARDMGMSQRTLQRRLRDEGSSFRVLVETARRELSTAMLSRNDVTLDGVAFHLGYRGTVSFHRAFRNWVGTSPVRWRRTPQPRCLSRATAGSARARD